MTVNVKVVPVGHSGLVVHAFERVTVLTSVESVEILHGAVVVPILHVMGFVPSKYAVSIGKVTLTPDP